MKKTNCPECGSRDNLILYGDGGWHCFTPGCSNHRSGEWSSKDVEQSNEPKAYTLKGEEIEETIRGIKADTYKKYGVVLSSSDQLLFPHYCGATLVGVKGVDKDKNWFVAGGTKNFGLFGTHTCRGSKRLIITEGHWDALSWHQATGYDAVSIPNGAASALKYIKKDLQWVESYENVYVCFDSDEAGELAATQVMGLLKPTIAKKVLMPVGYKDGNEMLVAGKASEMKSLLWSALSNKPKNLSDPEELANRAVAFLNDRESRIGVSTGYSSLDQILGGYRKGEVLVFAAGTGVGKSSFCRNLLWNLLAQDVPSLYIPLEDLTETALTRFAEMDLEQPIIKADVLPSNDDLLKSFGKILSSVTILEQNGGFTIDLLMSSIEYAVRILGTRVVVLDHITALAQMSELDNERKAIDVAMDAMKYSIAKALGVTVIVVTHLSRDTSDKDDNKPTLSRLKFASSIAQTADAVYGLTRPRDEHVTTVHTLKLSRAWGTHGTFELVWDHATQKMIEEDIDGPEKEKSRDTGKDTEGEVSEQVRSKDTSGVW